MEQMKITSTPAAEFDLTLETGARFAVLAVKELQGTVCFCGATKQSMQTFCKADYYRLPPAKRQALYNRIGQGYEEAYHAARRFLHAKQNRKS